MRRLHSDAWTAFVLLGASGASLANLFSTEGSGAYVKTTTLPIALAIVLAILSLALLGRSLWRPVEQGSEALVDVTPGRIATGGRVAGMVAWTIVYIAALPWLGYLVSTALYIGGLNLLYGNRRPMSVILSMVLVPVVLFLFFEKFMVVLLPSATLFS